MPRVKRGVTARARHKKIFALSKGFSLGCNHVYDKDGFAALVAQIKG